MPYYLTVTVTGMEAAIARIKAVDKVVNNSGKDVSVAAFNAMGKLFKTNFTLEGGLAGGWDDLARQTVYNREALGFGGEHPILIRYGDLRQVTATDLSQLSGSGTFGAVDAQGKDIKVTVKLGKKGGTATASGVKSLNQNPTKYAAERPYWFTTTVVQQAARKAAVGALAANIRKMRG